MFKNKPVKIITCVMLLLTAGLSVFAQGREVPFTQDDRDRLIRMEERIGALEKSTSERIEALGKSTAERTSATNERIISLEKSIDIRFNAINNLLYFILAGMFGLIGLIFWDRRSYVKPVKEDIRDIAVVL